jgi:hypothetical protein
LLEARASAALFAWTVAPGEGAVEPGLYRYFEDAAGPNKGRSCFSAAEAARAQGLRDATEYSCAGADDLQRSLSELDFSDIVLTRVFGSIGPAGVALRTSDEAERDSRVAATDFDAKDCPPSVSAAPGANGSTLPGGAISAADGSVTGTSVDYSSQQPTTVSEGDSCDVTAFSDSCSGDSSSSSSSSSSGDSCSGNSSSDPSSSDSCSGNSSSDPSSSDSCNGNSSSQSSEDSSGCGKSNYDGDTCSGNSASGASAGGKASADLEPAQNSLSSHRPRKVHLSLLTLLAALVALPLRRKKLWRVLSNP